MSSTEGTGQPKVAYYAAVFDSRRRLLLTRTGAGAVQFPGFIAHQGGLASPGTVLPHAVRRQTGLELAAIGPQLGLPHPFIREGGTAASGPGIAMSYLCAVPPDVELVRAAGGNTFHATTEAALVGQRICGDVVPPAVMLAMILDALATLREPEEIVVSDAPLLGPLEGLLPPTGVFVPSDCGTYLVGIDGPGISVWRRLTAEVRDDKVMAINPIAG